MPWYLKHSDIFPDKFSCLHARSLLNHQCFSSFCRILNRSILTSCTAVNGSSSLPLMRCMQFLPHPQSVRRSRCTFSALHSRLSMYSLDLGSLDVCDVESALAWVLATWHIFSSLSMTILVSVKVPNKLGNLLAAGGFRVPLSSEKVEPALTVAFGAGTRVDGSKAANKFIATEPWPLPMLLLEIFVQL